MTGNRPHSLDPKLSTIRCLIAYKNFAAPTGISHIGLGVSALNTSQVLRAAGIWVDVIAIRSAKELAEKIEQMDKIAIIKGDITISHVVVSAPWMPSCEWVKLVGDYPHITFCNVSHSNVAFLHADPHGVRLLREEMDIQMAWHNFTVGANSKKFEEWVIRSYGTDLTYLPNLYNLGNTEDRLQQTRPPWTRSGVLRIGSFGAIRVLKNTMTAVAAGIELSQRLGIDTEMWLSSGRTDGGNKNPILRSIEQLAKDVKGFTIKFNTWETWPQFRKTIRYMNILLQPSFTESFNMVTADGVSEGVPSVVSEAIEWVPDNWKANSDNALDIANKAVALLNDPVAPSEGRKALEEHNERGVLAWIRWFLPQIDPILSTL